MPDHNARSFMTKRGEFIARIATDELASPSVEAGTKSDRKFNIRIKQDDIFLLDALAKFHGVTRATLINEILHEVMRDELMSIGQGDARVLMACTADQTASYDELSQPWIYDALRSEFSHIIQNMLDYGSLGEGQPGHDWPSSSSTPEDDYRDPVFVGLRDKLECILK
ncbi:hypothetical protein RDV64_23405 (plasmid) [Acuticoccus sp. MNP-M23]|uniref:hypothetical protein n=1 Tax=Acuticoccus sp. MNP-M23 TaxID=3072793 RepID=UPI002815A42A|nr:hypothetical protein [Acuticoccus sp. MNP-M23]WMS45290.1 hypothetical protein RDV64_23405 [Acuticoccus sp. MNP-M23]